MRELPQRGGAGPHPVRRRSHHRGRDPAWPCPPASLPRPGAIPTEGALRDVVDAFERDVIRERLRATGGHVTAAARSLDLERSHLYKKCKQLGIDMREEG